MENILSQIGLNDKEGQFYLYLLKAGPSTALQVSKAMSETRTNTYMILKKLQEDGLVEAKPKTGGTYEYSAADPGKLRSLITAKQQELRQSQAALSSALPELSSMYRLGSHKPGVVYLEGIKGFKAFLDDIYKSGKTVHLLASDIVPRVDDAWAMLEKETRRRARRGIRTKAIFNRQLEKMLDRAVFRSKGFELRFWAKKPLEGEVVIYGNKVAFTVYEPTIMVTVITNDVLAGTLQSVFDQLWETANS